MGLSEVEKTVKLQEEFWKVEFYESLRKKV